MNSVTYSMKNGQGIFSRFSKIVASQCKVCEQLRFRHSLNLRKPPTHLKREIVLAVTKPKYPIKNEDVPLADRCFKAIKAQESIGEFVHPFDRILGNEIREKLLNARIVAVFHWNPMTNEQLFDFKVQLHRLKLKHVHINKKKIDLALKETPYEPLLKLYEAWTLTFFGSETNFAKLIKVEKKFPVHLIGGVYEGRIVSVSDFKNLASNSDIQSHRSQLAGLLAATGQKLTSNLTHHQQQLCSSLQRYIDDKSG